MKEVTITGFQDSEPIQEEVSIPQGQTVEITGATDQEESTLGAVGRNIASIGKNIASFTLGAGGDVRELAKNVLQTDFSPEHMQELAGALGKPELAQQWQQQKDEGVAETRLGDFLPTSEEVGKTIESKSQEYFGVDPSYFEPKGDIEKLIQETGTDFSMIMLNTLMGAPKGGIPFKAVRALVPNLVKMGVGKITDSEGAQFFAKAGTQLALSLLGQPSLEQAEKVEYDAAEKSRTEFETLKPRSGAGKPLSNSVKKLDEINKKINSGHIKGPAKILLEKHIDPIQFIEQNPSMTVKDAMENKNELGRLQRLKSTPPFAKKFFGQMRKAISDDLKLSDNKEFARAFIQADGITSAIHRNSNLFDRIAEIVPEGTGVISKALFKARKYGLAPLSMIGSMTGINGAFRVADRIFAIPAMRQYYKDVLRNVAKENFTQAAVAIKKFDKVAKKKFPEIESSK